MDKQNMIKNDFNKLAFHNLNDTSWNHNRLDVV